MTLKKSLSLSNNASAIIANRARADKKEWSSTVSHIIESYELLINSVEVKLSTKDWRILHDAYKNRLNQPPELPINMAIDLMRQKSQIDLNQLKQTDAQYASLVEKLAHLSQPQQLSILDKLKMFFAKNNENNTSKA